VPEWLNGAVSKTVVVLWATVGSNPTLSAGYKIPPRQLRLHLLPDLIILVVELSKCKGSATEIAQFALGDLTFFMSRINIPLMESLPGRVWCRIYPGLS
jgi:hypothetical protein